MSLTPEQEALLNSVTDAMEDASDVLQAAIDKGERLRREIVRCCQQLGKLTSFAIDDDLTPSEASCILAMLAAAAAAYRYRRAL